MSDEMVNFAAGFCSGFFLCASGWAWAILLVLRALDRKKRLKVSSDRA